MKKTDFAIRFFLYSLTFALVSSLLFAFWLKADAAFTTTGTVEVDFVDGQPTGAQNLYYGGIVLAAGQSVIVNAYSQQDSVCSNSQVGRLDLLMKVGAGATTTVAYAENDDAGSNYGCSVAVGYVYKASGATTLAFAVDIPNTSMDWSSLIVQRLTPGGGGGGGTVNNFFAVATSTSGFALVDIPIVNLWLGLILFFMVLGGTIAFFRRNK